MKLRKLGRLLRLRRKPPPTIHVTISGDASQLQAALRRAREQTERLGRRK